MNMVNENVMKKKYLLGLIHEYSEKYYVGEFSNCNIIFSKILIELADFLETSDNSITFNEPLKKALDSFEKKDWVLLNDILNYEIKNRL